MKHAIQTRPCPKCGSVATLRVELDALVKYEGGAFVQDAFPDMPRTDRERLVSAVCPKCWDAMFKEK